MNRSEIFKRAWKNYRKDPSLGFGEWLRRSWATEKARPLNDARIKQAATAAGIEEPVNTWAGWRDLGLMVSHGRKALFQVRLIHASKGPGKTYLASFFGASQTEIPLPATA